MYSKQDAIEILNQWGSNGIPFLFIIDFEMRSIILHRTDRAIPPDIIYNINNKPEPADFSAPDKPFVFKKYPVAPEIYELAFHFTRNQIQAGNSFLVNLTFPTRVETDLTLTNIYNRSNSRYKLLYKNEFVVFSPETFVTIKSGKIYSFPMKGTINASEEDAINRILQNPKEEAEHYTIVDLIRNDLSRVATQVEVKRFRYIDRIKTNQGDILQVSSEIAGQLPKDYTANLGSILFSLLPAGSVTGAPKQKTLEIINNAEGDERGYYTGIFGYFDGADLDSAVMIRYIENKNGTLFFRSGGGITFQSNWHDEYKELIDKVYVPFT